MKKLIIAAIGVLGLIVILIWKSALTSHNTQLQDTRPEISSNKNLPEIVEIFACGDYCPGPPEQYTFKVYKDVLTESDCANLGGKFESFDGWGTQYYCRVP